MKVRSQGTVSSPPPDTHTHFETGSLSGLNSVVQGPQGFTSLPLYHHDYRYAVPHPAFHMGFWVSDSRFLAYKEITSPT